MNKNYSEFQKKTEYHKNYDIKYYGLGLAGEAGEIANEIKKIDRDDNCKLTKKRKEKIIDELGDVIWYVHGICNYLDVPISYVMEKNMEKLTARILLRKNK